MSAVQTAVFAAISAALPAGTKVYDHVPARLSEDAWDGSPLVQIADITETQVQGKLRRVTVLVIVWSAERSREKAQDIRETIIGALHERALPPQPPAVLSTPFLVSTVDGALGETIINRSTASFTLFVQ